MKIYVCVLLMAVAAFAAAAADVSGKWSGTYTFDNGNNGAAVVMLKQAGAAVTGTAGPGEDQQWPIQNGKVAGSKVTCEVKSPEDGVVYKIDLTLAGDSLKGDISAATPDGQVMKGKIEVSRVK